MSLAPGVWKTFNTEDQTFWCCTGSGVEEYSKLNDSIYWRDRDGLYVNLFIPSELDWVEKGFRLRQETGYPRSQGTALIVIAARPDPLVPRLRGHPRSERDALQTDLAQLERHPTVLVEQRDIGAHGVSPLLG